MNQHEEKANNKPEKGNQRFRGEWIIASVLIGIISFPAGIFLIEFISKMHLFLPDGILYLLVLSFIIVLSAFYIYLRKMPAIFIVKVSVIATAVLIVVIAALLVPYLLPRLSSEPTLWLTKLDYEPDNYVEITPEELEGLPILQGLNNKSRYGRITELETTSKEKNRIVDLIKQKKKIVPDYPYEMWVRTTARFPDENQATPAYREITAGELEQFPAIEKAVYRPEMWYGISSDEWDSFLEFTQGYDDQNHLLIKFGDQFYQILNTEHITLYLKNADAESYIKAEEEYYVFRVGLVG